MKIYFYNLIICLLITTFSSSCTSFISSYNQSWETILSDHVANADSLEIPIPSNEKRTILIGQNEIQAFLNMIEIDESESDVSACFCRGNMNLYFKQGTNDLALITVYHDGKSLSWHNGLWPAYASLSKLSSEQLVGYFEGLEIKNSITEGNWKSSTDIPRPRMELEPLTQERLDRINQCEIKISQPVN